MLILASASPRRRDLLTEARFEYTVIPADVEEDADSHPQNLAQLVESNAALKATWVAARHPEATCIGADTLVSIDGQALGKPKDMDEAHAMVSRLAGHTHQVCTGVCLASRNRELRFHVTTQVTFKPLTSDEIRTYHALIQPLDKAGAYAAQDHGASIIQHTEGSWSNVVGLPMERLQEALKEWGITPCSQARNP